MFCVRLLKVEKGQSIQLDALFDDIKRLILNSVQRRKMLNNLHNSQEVRDVVKASAFVVLLIRVYRNNKLIV